MTKLGQIAEINSGGTPSRSHKEYWEDGNIPWIKISDIKDKYVNEAEEYITEEGLKKSSAKLMKPGTILYSIFATIGATAILNIEATTNQAIAGIRLNSEQYDTEFIYYFLKSLKSKMEQKSRGVAQNNINLNMLKDVDVPEIDIATQKQIVKKLESINELIAKKQQQINDYEKLINSEFYKTLETDSGEYLEISKLVSKVSNITKKDGEIKYIDISSIDNTAHQIVGYKKYKVEEAPSRAKQVLEENDILYSAVRPNLKNIAMVKKCEEDMIGSTGFVILRCKEQILPEYLYRAVLTDSFTNKMISKTVGATYPAITKNDILDERIKVIPLEEQQKLVDIINKIELLKDKERKDIEELKKLLNTKMIEFFN